MEFENLEKALNDYIEELADLYKRKLISDNKKASGDLINSVTANVEIDGNLYIAELELADYWKYVENGSKPHWPPKDAILKWIKKKPIIPRANKGITPTNDQLAYLIGRKIARDGIKPGYQLTMSIQQLNGKWLPLIEEAISKDILSYLETII